MFNNNTTEEETTQPNEHSQEVTNPDSTMLTYANRTAQFGKTGSFLNPGQATNAHLGKTKQVSTRN